MGPAGIREQVGRRMAAIRRWPLWELSAATRLLVIAVTSTTVVAAVTAAWQTTSSSRELTLFAALVAAGIVSIEATRRVPEPAGVNANDMLGAWLVAITTLLPPVYALTAPVVLMALTQWRVRRIAIYKRVYSAAAIGLAHATASVVFHSLPGPWTDWKLLAENPVPVVLAVVAVAAAAKVINAALIGAAVKTADPETRWRAVLVVERGTLEVTELFAGVLIALLAGITPLLVLIALLPVLLLQRGMLYAQLNAAARMDAKTGLLNAVSWEREAAAALSDARRHGQPVAVLLVDIDHFKRVNDTYGHLVGDDVLRGVAHVLRTQVRDAKDLICRFGGEEFAVFLPGMAAAEVPSAAERLRRGVADLVTPTPGDLVQVTVSVGATVTDPLCTPEETVIELLAAADLCLYRAKANGRDQVELISRVDRRL